MEAGIWQAPGVWLPAAGTPLCQGRPGRGNCLAIVPAAQGGLVWWQYQEPQQDRRADCSLDACPASYPGRSLGGNALSGFWFLLAAQKEPPAGSVPTGLASLLSRNWRRGDVFHGSRWRAERKMSSLDKNPPLQHSQTSDILHRGFAPTITEMRNVHDQSL